MSLAVPENMRATLRLSGCVRSPKGPSCIHDRSVKAARDSIAFMRARSSFLELDDKARDSGYLHERLIHGVRRDERQLMRTTALVAVHPVLLGNHFCALMFAPSYRPDQMFADRAWRCSLTRF